MTNCERCGGQLIDVTTHDQGDHNVRQQCMTCGQKYVSGVKNGIEPPWTRMKDAEAIREMIKILGFFKKPDAIAVLRWALGEYPPEPQPADHANECWAIEKENNAKLRIEAQTLQDCITLEQERYFKLSEQVTELRQANDVKQQLSSSTGW